MLLARVQASEEAGGKRFLIMTKLFFLLFSVASTWWRLTRVVTSQGDTWHGASARVWGDI